MNAPLDEVIERIDQANSCDPTAIILPNGETVPAALAYGIRMSDRLGIFKPNAAPILQIACRAQHLERWKLPRSDYPMDKAGYHAWRNEQKRRHAERVAGFMRDSGFSESEIGHCGSIIRKEGIKRDAETQSLEDVACLVFLEHYAAEFASVHDRGAIIDILVKTLRKMSEAGREHAKLLSLNPAVAQMVGEAREVFSNSRNAASSS